MAYVVRRMLVYVYPDEDAAVSEALEHWAVPPIGKQTFTLHEKSIRSSVNEEFAKALRAGMDELSTAEECSE